MKHTPDMLALAMAILLLTIPVSMAELTEGRHPLYIVKQIIRTTSCWTMIEWVQGLQPAVVRRNILQGADAQGLNYWFSGMSYGIGKDLNDTAEVVMEVESLALRGDAKIVLNVSKGGIGVVNIELYGYDKTKGDSSKLGEFQLRDCGPTLFEIDLSAFYGTSACTADIGKAIKELDRKVLAFYYQWYASPEGPSGGTLHWNEGFTDFPLMGLYDSADESVIAAHMAMAKYAGIDALIADYPLQAGYNNQTWPTMLRLADEMGLKLTHYQLPRRDLSQIREYASHPAFLKDSGRPVFFFYSPQIANAQEWVEYRAELEASIGPMVWIGNTIDEEYLGVYDAFHAYCYVTGYPGDDGKQYYSQAINTLKIGPRKMEPDEAFSLAYSGQEVALDLKSFFITVVPGIDDRQVREPGLLRDREGGEMYSTLWRTAMDLDADSVLITSWNEWHEGTEIEPSREYGFDYITMTRRLVEEYKRESLAKLDANFSAKVTRFEQRPDLAGHGHLVISAGEVAALYLNVTVRGDDSVSSVALEGGFYTYRTNRSTGAASVLIPAVGPQGTTDIEVVFEARSARPSFDISITAYDPSGRRFQVYSGRTSATVSEAGALITFILALLIAAQHPFETVDWSWLA